MGLIGFIVFIVFICCIDFYWLSFVFIDFHWFHWFHWFLFDLLEGGVGFPQFRRGQYVWDGCATHLIFIGLQLVLFVPIDFYWVY